MKEVFVHASVNVGKKKPYVVTTCMLMDGETLMARGTAICSPKDQYNRKVGNMIARGRAYKAFEHKATFSPLGKDLERRLSGPRFLSESFEKETVNG